MFKDRPLLGHGAQSFLASYQTYLPQLESARASTLSWLPPSFAKDVSDYAEVFRANYVPWPHNLYLEVLAEQGIVGFASLALLIFRGFYIVTTSRTSCIPGNSFFVASYSAFAALLAAACFDLTLLRRWVPFVFLLVLGAISVHRNSRQAHSPKG
jgi:O-antigen ligase